MDMDNILDLYNSATCISDLLDKLEKRNNVGNRVSLKKKLQLAGLDWDFLVQKGIHGGNVTRKVGHIPNILLFTINGAHRRVVKDRILRDQLIPYECQICKLLPIWNNNPIVLVLDHINGNHRDNQLHNLRFLCPNCNSQTPTFCRSTKPP